MIGIRPDSYDRMTIIAGDQEVTVTRRELTIIGKAISGSLSLDDADFARFAARQKLFEKDRDEMWVRRNEFTRDAWMASHPS